MGNDGTAGNDGVTGSRLAGRVARAAHEALTLRGHVTAIDVITGLRWSYVRNVDTWRQGRADSLERVTAVDAAKMADAVAILREWALARGLVPGESAYVSGGRDRRPLRFTVDGDEELERAFRVHWFSPELSQARRERLAERETRPPDLTVVVPLEPWTCAGCGDTGPHHIMEDDRPHCLTCADMDHLVFLPAGNAALSRRAKKESVLSAVVVRYNRRRKRFERQGILVEDEALARAEEQCLADEEVRLRRRERDRVRREAGDVEFQAELAGEIRRLFPGCPPERAEAIALHAGLRGSGRVGRTAAARVLDERAVTLAVVASVRHLDTDYDRLLMAGVPRQDARDRIRDRIDQVLTAWRA
ncbi:DUF2293 domain-containing protein [Microtetraspora niveoalba]|uniref:DUF2293 domain-containing protein n=1 Tax=Microtetraspora niveoalba TaxID=46175 RepID=UPI001FE15C00|nr:DUF2293 domain-containing protein [Microtetraspora niveoalba]